MVLLVALLLLLSGCAGVLNAEKPVLHFSFITALSGGSESSGGIPIIDFALEEINNDSRILPNYTLRYNNVLDSKCTSISALEAFLSNFDSPNDTNTYVSVMCCGCSSATIPVAEISHHWNIPHISFASSSPALNNRNRFKSFFRTLPCYVYVPPTIATMMAHFGWRQLAVITQNSSPFHTVTNGIQLIFDEQGWKLDQTALIEPADDNIRYDTLLNWDEDYRIIFVNTFELHAYHIVCEVLLRYGQRLIDQEIVLILHGRYPHDWWESAYQTVDSRCSREEVMMGLNRTLTITPDTYDLLEDPTAQSISGITPPEFERQYKHLMSLPQYRSYSPLNFYGNAYDAMWAIAIGLHNADLRVQRGDASGCDHLPGELVPLHLFNYSNQLMGCVMKEGYAAENFTGITGSITFKPDGARPENVMRLRQHRVIQNGVEYSVTRPTAARVVNEDTYSFGVVTYDNNGVVVFVEGESPHTLWPDGVTPYDGTPNDVVEGTHSAVTVVFTLLASLGLLFTVACLVFNAAFKNKKSVKLGSPNLNFLIIAGVGILYVSMFFYIVPANSLGQQQIETILCNFKFWLFALGYTLSFAVILAKQWRVYYIFSNPSTKKMFVKDWVLLIVVAALVGIDLFICLMGTAFPRSRLLAMPTISQALRKNGQGMNEMVYVFTCTNAHAIIWIGVSFGYKILLQFVAIFMAFTTRKVNVKALNDTKENCIMIYINTIILVVLTVTEFAFRSSPTVYTAVFGLAIFLEASLFLGVVFVPKMVLLHIDPEGKTIFKDSQPPTGQFILTGGGGGTNRSQDKTLDTVPLTAPAIRARITELQEQLALLEKAAKNGEGPRGVKEGGEDFAA